MSNWWSQRAPRERVLLGAGTLFILLALAWAMVWHPMTARQAALESRLTTQQRTLVQLQQAQALRGAHDRKSQTDAGSSPPGQNESLAVVVDRGMRMGGLAAAIRSIQPAGEKQLTITLEQAPFDLLVAWLEQAGNEQGVGVVEASMDRGNAEGSVNARLTVQRDH
jgi:general secretion pathway protein M